MHVWNFAIIFFRKQQHTHTHTHTHTNSILKTLYWGHKGIERILWKSLEYIYDLCRCGTVPSSPLLGGFESVGCQLASTNSSAVRFCNQSGNPPLQTVTEMGTQRIVHGKRPALLGLGLKFEVSRCPTLFSRWHLDLFQKNASISYTDSSGFPFHLAGTGYFRVRQMWKFPCTCSCFDNKILRSH